MFYLCVCGGGAGMNNESISWELHYWMASPSDHPIYWCMTRKRKNSQDILYICITDMIFRFQILTKVTFSSAMRDSFNCIQLLHSDISKINPWSSINMGTSEDHQMSCFRRHQTLDIWLRRSDIHQGDVYFSSMRIFIRGGHGILVNEWRLQRIIVTSATTVDIEGESSHLSNSIR